MHLSEGTSKGCFATLVWPGHHEYALFVFEVKVITDDGRICADEFIGERQVERLGCINIFTLNP
jgi:hypothetical protein